MPTIESIEVEPGVRLSLRHRGGLKTPFLLVHGLSSNARLWDEVAEHLAEAGHPSWAVDLRSHGESDAPASGYDTATAASDLVEVLTQLRLQGTVVAGQSWGGNVVVQLAAKHPELVGALALVDGGWIDLQASFSSWAECEERLRPPDVDGQPASRIWEWLESSHPDWSATAKEATAANLRVRPDGTLERRLNVEHHMMILRSMWDSGPGPFLPLVSAPTVLMPACGADDPQAARIRAAAAQLQTATISWYPDSDHDLHAQHPAQVAADLLAMVD